MRLLGIRRQFVIAAVFVLLVVGLTPLFVDRMSPRSQTETHMAILQRCISEFALQRGRLPNDLTELRSSERWDSRWILDGYERPIRYQVNTNQEVELLSLGKDDRPGGTGADGDAFRTFVVRTTLRN